MTKDCYLVYRTLTDDRIAPMFRLVPVTFIFTGGPKPVASPEPVPIFLPGSSEGGKSPSFHEAAKLAVMVPMFAVLPISAVCSWRTR